MIAARCSKCCGPTLRPADEPGLRVLCDPCDREVFQGFNALGGPTCPTCGGWAYWPEIPYCEICTAPKPN